MIPAELLPAVAAIALSVVALLLARLAKPKRRYPNGSKNLVIVIDGKALTAQLS
jgi:hypothetical protein